MEEHLVKRVLEGDSKTISFRPEFAKEIKSITAAILLQQVFYTWRAFGEKPFYKFKQQCEHPDYRDGDSWCETMGFSPKEFDTARKHIAQKVTKDSTKDNDALVWYWVTIDRKTYYELNWRAFYKFVQKAYGKGEVYVNAESEFTKIPNGDISNPTNGHIPNPTNGMLDNINNIQTIPNILFTAKPSLATNEQAVPAQTGEVPAPSPKPPSPKKTEAKTKQERVFDFKMSLKPYAEKYPRQMLIDFAMYWTESNPKGQKLRFEMQKVFDLSLRLATWYRKSNGKYVSAQQPNNLADIELTEKEMEAYRQKEGEIKTQFPKTYQHFGFLKYSTFKKYLTRTMYPACCYQYSQTSMKNALDAAMIELEMSWAKRQEVVDMEKYLISHFSKNHEDQANISRLVYDYKHKKMAMAT